MKNEIIIDENMFEECLEMAFWKMDDLIKKRVISSERDAFKMAVRHLVKERLNIKVEMGIL